MSFSCDVVPVIETYEQELSDLANKCRLCGISDAKNVNIFAATNYEKLLTKIYTVYPIIIYKDDPLPKYICRKCIYNVGFMFNDIQKVLRNQMQWISHVRATQPKHAYFKLLQLLQQSHEDTRNFIKTSMQQDVDKEMVYRSLVMDEIDTEHLRFKSHATIVSNINQELSKSTPTVEANINSFSFDYEAPKVDVLKKTDEESNGFSLASDNDKSDENSLNANSMQTNDSAESDVEDDIVLTHLKELPQEPVKCTHCPLTFDNLSLLSTHQMTHIQLSIPKIFEKRLLPRALRRGRLITVEERKCIRCLNCWRVFADNKSILEHWSAGECDYYCQICGMEFAQSPKLLREHISTEHGISFRALKHQRELMSNKQEPSILDFDSNAAPAQECVPNTTIETVKPLQVPPITITNNSSIKDMKRIVAAKVVAMSGLTPSPPPTKDNNKLPFSKPFNPNQCPICDQMFQNGKARNSHMRKHKPPRSFAELQLRNEQHSYPIAAASFKMSNQYNSQQPVQQPNILQAALMGPKSLVSNALPPLQPIQRGVRTKFVPPREDPNNLLPTSGTSGIKVRSLNDLQTNNSPLLSPLHAASKSPSLEPSLYADTSMPESIKAESIADDVTNSAYDYFNQSPSVTARSTPTVETPKTEAMEMDYHNDDDNDDEDEADNATNSLATCELCSKCFLYEDDLRLHKAQVHRAST